MNDFPWEDNLLERKLESDLKDLLKTLVAFSNSVQPNHVATILLGEKDDGSVQGVKNPDNIEKALRKECDKIYPPILWRSKIYEKEGKFCVRVEIEYDGDTPHFGGPSWIRKGSETIIATDELFQKLIDLRSGMVREIAKWLNKEITVQIDVSSLPSTVNQGAFYKRPIPRWGQNDEARIVHVNNFWVTLERSDNQNKLSEPLKKITLSFDDQNDRLMLIVTY